MNLYAKSDTGQYYQPEISVFKGDITKLEVDAIVNSANPYIAVGGGVDGAIHSAAGEGLFEEYKKIGGCKKGSAVITKGYNLYAKNVIHTVAPIYGKENGNEKQILETCYISCLEVAKENKIRTIAFPSIGTGAFRYPIEEASKIAGKTIKEWLRKNLYTDVYIFNQIYFVLFSEEDKKVYLRNLKDIWSD